MSKTPVLLAMECREEAVACKVPNLRKAPSRRVLNKSLLVTDLIQKLYRADDDSIWFARSGTNFEDRSLKI